MKTFKVHNFPKDHYNKGLFDSLNIIYEKKWHHFGSLSNIDKTNLIEFISSIGNNNETTIKKVANYIYKSIKIILKKYKNTSYKHFWLTIRSFIPTDDYKNTRWHTDGRFFSTDRKQFKIVSIPKGASTLLKEPNDKTREKFVKISAKQTKELSKDYSKENFVKVIKKYGKKLQKILEKSETFTIKNNQYLEFNTGSQGFGTGAIHSEPDISEPRLFFSLVLGTEEEVKELDARWNKKN